MRLPYPSSSKQRASKSVRSRYGGHFAAAMATLCLVLLTVTGCAKVTVRKVPTPSQYLRWTDAQQEKSDKMEGLRFYLPRPFVSVFESFPIRTDIYLANGLVSPDGKYVIITSVTGESSLSRYIATDPRYVRVPTDQVFDRNLAVRPQSASEVLATFGKSLLSGTPGGEILPTGVVGPRAPSPEAPVSSPAPPSAPQPRTGMGQRKSANDNGAFAYQPLRGNFDLVYLPDFEEQYVVSEKAGLGNAMFEINLGQGWSLQGFNSLTDNSELNRRIFDLIDSAAKLAKSAASSALGIPPLPDLAPGAGGMIRPQGADEALGDKGGLSGTPVTLKIVVVHYAAKGLYPVIKPRELQERSLDPGDSFGILDLFKLFPKVQMSSNFDPTAITRAQAAIESQTGSFTVPRYPYQYVSFNTFRYMAIEVVRPTDEKTSPFQHLYDKTGTVGDVGDTRTGDIVALLERLRLMYGPATEETNGGSSTETGLADIADSMKTRTFQLNGATFEIVSAAVIDEKLTVGLRISEGRTEQPISENDLLKAVLAEATTLTNEQGIGALRIEQLKIKDFTALEPSLVPEEQRPTPAPTPEPTPAPTPAPTTTIQALKNQSFVVADVTLNFGAPVEANRKLQIAPIYLSGVATATVDANTLLQNVFDEVTRLVVAAGLPTVPKDDITITNFPDLEAKLTAP